MPADGRPRHPLPSGDDDLAHTLAELAAQGYDRADRKYVVWVDANELCGISSYYEDDRIGLDNFNNGNPTAPGTVSRIDNGCWGLGSQGESIEAHEIMHALGSVMPTAPHMTLLGHCTDDADRMCYQDESAVVLNNVCASTEEALFDCHKDDYFDASPAPAAISAGHWNTARSGFLANGDGDPRVGIVGSTIPEGEFDTKPLTFTISLAVPSLDHVGPLGDGRRHGRGRAGLPGGRRRRGVRPRGDGEADHRPGHRRLRQRGG